ncbi:hypothetical protein GCM10009609_37860 [Pseudonocardia aurantiaca]
MTAWLRRHWQPRGDRPEAARPARELAAASDHSAARRPEGDALNKQGSLNAPGSQRLSAAVGRPSIGNAGSA